MREAVAGGRRRRLRGDRLPRVLRARCGGARPRAGARPGTRRAQHDALRAGRDRRCDLALELPPCDSGGDDLSGARRRQLGCPEARRAIAGLLAGAGRGAARCGRPGGRARPAAWRGRRRRRAGPRPAGGADRVHGLGRGRAGDRPGRRGYTARPGSGEAGRRRDGRQELRDRRRRRRPRRRGPGDRRVSVRLRRAEVLGRVARARARGGRRRAARAPRRGDRRARRRSCRQLRDRRAAADRGRRPRSRRALPGGGSVGGPHRHHRA